MVWESIAVWAAKTFGTKALERVDGDGLARGVKKGFRKVRKTVPGGEPTQFRVLVARIVDDNDNHRRELIVDTLESIGGLDVMPIAEAVALKEDQSGPERDAAARALLDEYRGDLLVAGRYLPDHTALRLRAISREDGAQALPGLTLDSPFELPAAFGEGAVAAMQAIVLARITVTEEAAGSYLAGRLAPALERLRPLIPGLTERLGPAEAEGVLFELANAEFRLGEQSGQKAPLLSNVRLCRTVLDGEGTEAQNRGAWLTVLGNTLRLLGVREGSAERLEQAVDAYSAALEETMRERAPLSWGACQNNLGTALRALGERKGSAERLEQAVAAYRAALEEQTRERVPFDWAMTQNNLGNTLAILGERGRSAERMEEAVVAYRAALEERTRDRVPFAWATTQSNLGNAQSTLGEWEGSAERLGGAVAAYHAALEERTRERVPLDWAVTQHNLGNALLALGKLEGSVETLERAAEAARGALDVFRELGVVGYSEGTETNLAGIEAALQEMRRGGTADNAGETG